MRIGRPGLIGARVCGEARRRQSSRGGVLPELAKLGPLGWDSSGKRAREAQCGTHNPPRVTAGLAEARSSGHSCGGGSAAAGSPASACSRWGVLRTGRKRVQVRVQNQGKPLPGLCSADTGCSGPATAVLRLCGGGAPVFAFWLPG